MASDNMDHDVEFDGKQSRERLNSLSTLPIEILVHIVSFLTCVRDLVILRYVSRRLRCVCETPSLWKRFTWPHFDTREESCVKGALKSCGQFIKILSLYHVTPFKLAMLQHCSNLVELRLSTNKLSSDRLGKTIRSMRNLQILHVLWTGKIHLLLVTCNRLKELTVIMEELYFTEVLTEWAAKGFIPNMLSIISTKYFRTVDIAKAIMVVLEC